MTKPTLWIQAIPIQPEVTIPWVNPGIFTMAILAFTSLLTETKNEYYQLMEETNSIYIKLYYV